MKKSSLIVFLAFVLVLILTSSCQNNSSNGNAKDSDSIVYAEKIIKQIKNGKPIFLKGKRIVGKLDFTKAGEINNDLVVSTIYIDSEIVFQNCTFSDSVTSFMSDGSNRRIAVCVFDRNVIFEECQFEESVDFTQSVFKSRFTFDLSKVKGTSSFDGTNFNAYTSFNSANFDDNVSFVSSAFLSRVNFMKTFYKKDCIFQFVRFSDISMFTDSHFYGYTEFSKIVALTDLNFSNVQFLNRAVFIYSQYFNGLRMPKCKFAKNLQVEGNTFLGDIQLSKAEFDGICTLKSNLFTFYPKMDGVTKSDSLSIELSDNKITTITTNIDIFNTKK